MRLAPEDITAIAEAVVDLLEERGAPERRRLVDAATVARELKVSRPWVYENADALGAVRLGEGERPRLRFDLERARQQARVEVVQDRTSGLGQPRARRRRSSSSSAGLLPVKGER